MSQRTLYTDAGRAVELGREIGSGGYGAVFEVPSDPNSVAKCYSRPPKPELVDKLREMVRLVDPELKKVTAWPSGVLHTNPSGPIAGFLMGKVSGHEEIHDLYGPAARASKFPAAGWDFLVHVGRNYAAAFEEVHKKGHVIFDVNERNVLVSQKGTVCLIDCDSFQIRSNGRWFPSYEARPEFTPPELQGCGYRREPRTPNHDLFGLAVIVFQLLFMGKHPFVGRFLGPGDLPIDQAIKEYRFAYSKTCAANQMEPPPGFLPLRTVSPDLCRLFERAFSQHSYRTGARPSASQWVTSLTDFLKQLRTCPADSGHKIPSHLAECPWHALMRAGGINFFETVAWTTDFVDPMSEHFDLDDVWRQIEAIAVTNHASRTPPAQQFTPLHLPSHIPPPLAPFVPTVLPERVTVSWSDLEILAGCASVGSIPLFLLGLLLGVPALWVVGSIGVGGFFVWCLVLEGMRRQQEQRENADWNELRERSEAEKREMRERERAREEALRPVRSQRMERLRLVSEDLQRALIHWDQQASTHRQQFIALKSSLEHAKICHTQLLQQQTLELKTLEQNAKQAQLKQFLAAQFISHARIPGIGPQRQLLLRSYNVETALHLTREALSPIPRIGPAYTRNLMEWRAEKERAFHFDPQLGTPQQQVTGIKAKYRRQRYDLEKQLGSGAERLGRLSTEGENELSALSTKMEGLFNSKMQAEADLSICS